MAQTPRKFPEALRPLFWNQVFHRLSWNTDRDLITARILEYGGWDAVCWLWRRLGDDGLRDWLVARGRAGLLPRKLRYWGLGLGLPSGIVDTWLDNPCRQVWDNRSHARTRRNAGSAAKRRPQTHRSSSR